MLRMNGRDVGGWEDDVNVLGFGRKLVGMFESSLLEGHFQPKARDSFVPL
jgi:hypothetical protein